MSNIKYFDIVHSIVDLVLQGRNDAFRQKVVQNLEMYYDSSNPDFSKQETRLAYAYMYLAANASLIENIFTTSRDLSEFFDDQFSRERRVSIGVFGAGPGTEVLGVNGWILRRSLPNHLRVDYTLFEVVKDWEKSLKTLLETVESNSQEKNYPLSVSGQCQPCYGPQADITEFAAYEAAEGHDIYIFSYVLSEIPPSFQHKLFEFGTELRCVVPHGAKLVFLDRDKDFDIFIEGNICAILDGMKLEYKGYQSILDTIEPSEWQVAKECVRFSALRELMGRWPRGRNDHRKAHYTIVTNG